MYADSPKLDAASDRPLSPIEAAYDSLYGAQAELHGLLGALFSRLDSVLRPCEPVVISKEADNPAMSELHGQLLGRAEHTRDQCARVEELLRRLTL